MRFITLGAAAAVAFLSPATAAPTAPVNRRAWVPSNPQAFEVDIGFDQAGRYVITIGMGKPFAKAGNFSFLLSTSSPYTAVAAVGCTTCVEELDQSPLYNLSKSSSGYSQGTTHTFNIGQGSIFGPVIRESCLLTKKNGSRWMYDNQTVIMAQSTEGVFGNGSSGFLGLGRSTGNDSYTSAILQTRGWSKLLFGLALNSYNSTADTTTAQSAGLFSVQELNQDMYEGKVFWQPIANVTDVPENVPTDWALKFDSYDISSGSQSTHSSGGVAIIEPYFPELRIPSSEAIDFFNTIPAATMTNDSTTLSWVVPCNQDLALAITIGDNTYRLKGEELINSDSTRTVCTSLVKGWANPSIRTYLFGRPFATTAYLAYNALLDPSADSIGVARRAGGDTTIIIQNPGVSGRTVAVSIVGSIVGVAIVAALLFLFIRWRRRARSDKPRGKPRSKPRNKPRSRSRLKRNIKKEYIIEPFTGGGRPNSTTPLIPPMGRQDDWIVEQGEIGGEPGTHDPRSEPWSIQNEYSPRMPDRKSPLPSSSPRLVLERQSQITGSSYSSEPSPRRGFHSGSSTPVPPAPPERQHNIPDGLAPPPYER